MSDNRFVRQRYNHAGRASSAAGPGVDLSAMSQEERGMYARRLHGPLPKGVRGRPMRLSLALVGAALFVGVLCVAGAARYWGEEAVGVAVAVVVVGYVGCSTLVERIFGAARRSWAASYLSEIGYRERLKAYRARHREPRPSGDDHYGAPNPYWFTGEYNPSRYYSFSKVERDIAKAHGMDADHWEANRPD